GGQAGARVLVADGDSASLSMTEMRLAAAGFEVLTCQDGARAFDMISSEHPDVVIAETALPKLEDRKSTRLNSSHVKISYAVFCRSATRSPFPSTTLFRSRAGRRARGCSWRTATAPACP